MENAYSELYAMIGKVYFQICLNGFISAALLERQLRGGEGSSGQRGGCEWCGGKVFQSNWIDVGSDEGAQFNCETLVGAANTGLELYC